MLDFVRMRRDQLWLLIVTMVALPFLASCYNVLFLMPCGSRSHRNALHPIAEELGRRGHQVTFVSTLPEDKRSKGVEDVVLKSVTVINEYLSEVNFFDERQVGNMFNLNNLKRIHSFMCTLIRQIYSDPYVQEWIQHPRVAVNGSSSTSRPRYDVIIVNSMYNEYNLPLAHHLGAPIIYASPTILVFTLSWSMNIPNPPYVPGTVSFVTGDQSFWQRAYTAVSNFLFVQLRTRIQLPSYDNYVREFLPDAPSINDIERNVSFLLTNSHFAINPSAPSMPYHAEVGGAHCRPAEKLSKDLEDFMQSSGDHGVIYFAFGSIQKGKDLPKDLKRSFITVFSELKQKVLWKYEEQIEDLPRNIKLIYWAPQQDILGHPKVRLFISHGGGLSVHETCYHGKPILGLPLGIEQVSNVGNAVRLGFGEYIDWKTFSDDDLREKIKKLLHDPKYTSNAAKVSRRFRDRPEKPAELAAYWIEYVARHNGARHLRSGAEELNLFQYFLLDVILLIVLVVTICLGITWVLASFVVRKLIRCLSKHCNKRMATNKKHATNGKQSERSSTKTKVKKMK